MTELDELLASKSSITEQTKKNYTRIYNKLIDNLDDNIQDTSEKELIELVLELSKNNPSVALTYINIPIMIKKHFNKDVEKLVKKQVELNKSRVEHTKGLIETKKEELPSYDVLNNHLKSLLKNKDYQNYIINYILINYGTRNKDLDLFITERKNVKNIDDGRNYIFIKNTECEIVIGNYKTIQNYGVKRFVVKSKHFRDACLSLGLNTYLLYNDGDKSKPINETSLGTYIKRRLYNNLTESDYFKILIKNAQTKKNPLNEIQKLSLSRGTDINTIISHYNIQVGN